MQKAFFDVRDKFGNAYAGSIFTVYDHGTVTLATILADDEVTELDNPGFADQDGDFSFKMVDDSAVDIVITNSDEDIIKSLIDVTFPAAGGGGGSGVSSVNSRTGAVTLVAVDIPTMIASGTGHAGGVVPDPGGSSGTIKFLREDATWAVPPSGGGGSSDSYSPVDIEVGGNIANFVGGAGNNTVGERFQPCVAGKIITGVKFYWGRPEAGVVTCVIYDEAGSALVTSSAVVIGATSPGVYTAVFGSPYTIVAADLGKYFIASMYDSSHYNSFNSPRTLGTMIFSQGYIWRGEPRFAVGNAFPTSASGGDMYPVEPVIS